MSRLVHECRAVDQSSGVPGAGVSYWVCLTPRKVPPRQCGEFVLFQAEGSPHLPIHTIISGFETRTEID